MVSSESCQNSCCKWQEWGHYTIRWTKEPTPSLHSRLKLLHPQRNEWLVEHDLIRLLCSEYLHDDNHLSGRILFLPHTKNPQMKTKKTQRTNLLSSDLLGKCLQSCRLKQVPPKIIKKQTEASGFYLVIQLLDWMHISSVWPPPAQKSILKAFF